MIPILFIILSFTPIVRSAEVALETRSLEDKIVSKLQLYVAEALSVDLPEIQVSKLSATNGQSLNIQGEVVRVKPTNRGRLLGRRIFVIGLLSHDGHAMEHRVSADIVKIQKVVVTRRKLRRLDIVEADDVTLEMIRTRNQRRRYENDPEAVIGKRLIQSLGKGVPVRVDQLELAPLIRRGDRVTMVFKSEGLKILTTGEAKQDGNLGETIKVVNLDSKKMVFGEVLNSGDVGVNLQRSR